MAERVRVYWDACAWLGLLNNESDKREALEHVWKKAERGDLEIWASAFCIAEVHKVKCEGNWQSVSQENDEKINNLFDQDFVYIVQLDSEIAKLAKLLLRTHERLKKPSDAVHLATALHWNIEQMHTYDGSDLLHLDGAIKTVSGQALTICKADFVDGETLFNRPMQAGVQGG